MTAALQVENLTVELPAGDGWRRVVDGVSFTLEPGDVLGLAGESGSGKSQLLLALLGLLTGSTLLVLLLLKVEGLGLAASLLLDFLGCRGGGLVGRGLRQA